MNNFLTSCVTLFATTLLSVPVWAQTTIVTDNFTDRSTFKDNTLLLNWGANSSPQSGYSLQSKTDASTPVAVTYNSVCLTADAIAHSGYTAANSLKTLTSIDYEFPALLDRNGGDIKIEFDGIWNGQDNGGESGRLVVTLMGDYPAGGGQFDEVYDTNLINPFGRPLYNIRIRNSNSANGPMMLYGAGLSTDPEWEIYGTSPGWWLPGFSVQSGGGSPGSGPDYPASGTKKSSLVVTSTTVWRHYTWVIKPERLELYYRNSNQPATADVLIFFMQTPSSSNPATQLTQINAAHSTSAAVLPPYYNYYNSFKAIRFYWRGSTNSHLANVRVTQNSGVLSYNSIRLDKPVLQNGKVAITANVLPAQTNNHPITLQHSYNGTTFTNLFTEVVPAGKTNITLGHTQPGDGTNFYRSLCRDAAGQIMYSNIVSVKNIIRQPLTWQYRGTNVIQLNIPAAYLGVLLTVTDLQGRVLVNGPVQSAAKLVSVTSGGMLFYRLGNTTGKILL